jgi:hypothetical protein
MSAHICYHVKFDQLTCWLILIANASGTNARRASGRRRRIVRSILPGRWKATDGLEDRMHVPLERVLQSQSRPDDQLDRRRGSWPCRLRVCSLSLSQEMLLKQYITKNGSTPFGRNDMRRLFPHRSVELVRTKCVGLAHHTSRRANMLTRQVETTAEAAKTRFAGLQGISRRSYISADAASPFYSQRFRFWFVYPHVNLISSVKYPTPAPRRAVSEADSDVVIIHHVSAPLAPTRGPGPPEVTHQADLPDARSDQVSSGGRGARTTTAVDAAVAIFSSPESQTSPASRNRAQEVLAKELFENESRQIEIALALFRSGDTWTHNRDLAQTVLIDHIHRFTLP